MHTSSPEMLRLPSLKPTYTGSTDDSVFSSGLTTPSDEEVINVSFHSYEASDIRLIEDPVSQKPKPINVEDTPHSDSLFRQALRAAGVVKYVVVNPKKLGEKWRPVDAQTCTGGDPQIDTETPSNNVDIKAKSSVCLEKPAIEKPESDEESSGLISTPTQAAFSAIHPPSPLLKVDFVASRVLNVVFGSTTSPVEPLTIFACLRFAILAVLLPLYSGLVGACIMLAPSHINTVAFGNGYYFKHPPQGIARLSHWSHTAYPHVFTFIAIICVFARYHLYPGVSIAAIIATRFLTAWSDFKLDKSIPLGADDRQAIFLAVTNIVIDEGFVFEENGVLRMIPNGSGMKATDLV